MTDSEQEYAPYPGESQIENISEIDPVNKDYYTILADENTLRETPREKLNKPVNVPTKSITYGRRMTYEMENNEKLQSLGEKQKKIESFVTEGENEENEDDDDNNKEKKGSENDNRFEFLKKENFEMEENKESVVNLEKKDYSEISNFEKKTNKTIENTLKEFDEGLEDKSKTIFDNEDEEESNIFEFEAPERHSNDPFKNTSKSQPFPTYPNGEYQSNYTKEKYDTSIPHSQYQHPQYQHPRYQHPQYQYPQTFYQPQFPHPQFQYSQYQHLQNQYPQYKYPQYKYSNSYYNANNNYNIPNQAYYGNIGNEKYPRMENYYNPFINDYFGGAPRNKIFDKFDEDDKKENVKFSPFNEPNKNDHLFFSAMDETMDEFVNNNEMNKNEFYNMENDMKMREELEEKKLKRMNMNKLNIINQLKQLKIEMEKKLGIKENPYSIKLDLSTDYDLLVATYHQWYSFFKKKMDVKTYKESIKGMGKTAVTLNNLLGQPFKLKQLNSKLSKQLDNNEKLLEDIVTLKGDGYVFNDLNLQLIQQFGNLLFDVHLSEESINIIDSVAGGDDEEEKEEQVKPKKSKKKKKSELDEFEQNIFNNNETKEKVVIKNKGEEYKVGNEKEEKVGNEKKEKTFIDVDF